MCPVGDKTQNAIQPIPRLGYFFADAQLLQQGLTHRSFSPKHNERLEFLGDSVLNLIISGELYKRFGDLTEGELTRLRALLVREATLAGIARSIDLGSYLQLGGGELKSGGFDRDSILADAFEALLGAIYLDGGLDAVTRVILKLYAERLECLDPSKVPKDSKTELQEELQKSGRPLPVYELRSIEGEPHTQQFFVDCIVDNMPDVSGEGSSRRNAEQDAAAKMLMHLRQRETR